MRIRSTRIESSPKLMIIPMIDVIFFLLVFFMLSALQMVEQKVLPVQLPQAVAAQSLKTVEPLAVTLRSDGRVSIDDELVAIDKISSILPGLLQERPTTMVVLRADRSAEHGAVIAVMDAIKRAGVQKISIAAEGKI